MMQDFISFVARKKRASSTDLTHHHHNNIQDSNEDILRIIKLYNHGTMKTINEYPEPVKKYPYLLKYRASDFYVIFTSAFTIFTSVYVNSSLSPITSYIIEHQITSGKIYLDDNTLLTTDIINYVLSCFYLFGLLAGSLFFGWLGHYTSARKLPLLLGTLILIMSSGAYMVSSEYWMLLPAKFMQGISNTGIWFMCVALISDIWQINQVGLMNGLIFGLFPLGMSFGLTVGAIFSYTDHKRSFYCALAFCITSLFMQVVIIERSTVPSDWLEPKSNEMIDEHHVKDMQEVHCAMEIGNCWSKSSSLSTINLRDKEPPIVDFDKEKNISYSLDYDQKKRFVLFRLVTSFHFLSLSYQLLVISMILGAMEPSLTDKLKVGLNITRITYQGIIQSTFLLPCAVTAFGCGWLCDQFGAKIVGLTSVIVSIPIFIWIGVPNQNIQSIVSALVMGGITVAGLSVSVFFSITKIASKVFFYRQKQPLSTLVFAAICTISGFGFFIGDYFLKSLNELVGFFWLNFMFAMLLVTFIPLMLYHPENSFKQTMSHSTSKKSIVNSTRPESFAESTLSDDTTVGSSSIELTCQSTDSKSVIVMP